MAAQPSAGQLEGFWWRTGDKLTLEPPIRDDDAAIIADIGRGIDLEKGIDEVLEIGTGRIDRIFVLVPDDEGEFHVATRRGLLVLRVPLAHDRPPDRRAVVEDAAARARRPSVRPGRSRSSRSTLTWPAPGAASTAKTRLDAGDLGIRALDVTAKASTDSRSTMATRQPPKPAPAWRRAMRPGAPAMASCIAVIAGAPISKSSVAPSNEASNSARAARSRSPPGSASARSSTRWFSSMMKRQRRATTGRQLRLVRLEELEAHVAQGRDAGVGRADVGRAGLALRPPLVVLAAGQLARRAGVADDDRQLRARC